MLAWLHSTSYMTHVVAERRLGVRPGQRIEQKQRSYFGRLPELPGRQVRV